MVPSRGSNLARANEKLAVEESPQLEVEEDSRKGRINAQALRPGHQVEAQEPGLPQMMTRPPQMEVTTPYQNL